MAGERDSTLEALRAAVQMEIDGKAFYLKASDESTNEMGKKLLRTLSAEEDLHRQKFEQIYQAIQQKKAWPSLGLAPDRPQTLRTLFAQETGQIGSAVPGAATELDAIQTAMDMENKSYDFYRRRGRSAAFTAEKDFYEAVAAEESVHHELLRDYYEYLKDPVHWFTQKERPSLDGA